MHAFQDLLSARFIDMNTLLGNKLCFVSLCCHLVFNDNTRFWLEKAWKVEKLRTFQEQQGLKQVNFMDIV